MSGRFQENPPGYTLHFIIIRPITWLIDPGNSMQCLHTTSAILAGAHSYFVVSSFKCEGNNSSHDLIPSPRVLERLLFVRNYDTYK